MLEITYLGIEAGAYRFDMTCTDCGGYVLSVEDPSSDTGEASCKACGSSFGMFGEIKAKARSIAEDWHNGRDAEPRDFRVTLKPDDSLINGFKFMAVLHFSTPLRVLERHNERHYRADTHPPLIAENSSHGGWTWTTKSWREMGIDVDLPPETMSSLVGLIPVDGGDFLAFLVACRRILEGSSTDEDCLQLLKAELYNKRWHDFVIYMGGLDRVLSAAMSSR